MKLTVRLIVAFGIVAAFVLSLTGQTQRDEAVTQGGKPIYIYRIYTGPDNLSHAEKIEAKFNPTFKLMTVTGSTDLRRGKAGQVVDWHTAGGGNRHYVVNLAGHHEIEVSGGVKVELGPGDIELIEDLTGKGHITRNIEDNVGLWMPIADQAPQ
jgi:hypothetical protein